MKTQVKKTISFKVQAEHVAQFVQGKELSEMQEAVNVATELQAVIVAHPREEMQAQLSADLRAAFEALTMLDPKGKPQPRYTEGTAKKKASQWARVIVELAWGTRFDNCPHLQAAYDSLNATKKPRKRIIKAKSATVTNATATFKAELEACEDRSVRNTLAVNAVMGIAAGLKDRSPVNMELAKVLEYALANPQEVVALMESKATLAHGRRLKRAA